MCLSAAALNTQALAGDGTDLGDGGRPSLLATRLGLVAYQQAWDLQRSLVEARRADLIPDTLLLLQHPHTYTLGRRGKREHVLLTDRQLKRRRIALYDVDRGGDVTYHGPGQLVGYPILRMERGRLNYIRYIREVEAAMREAVSDLGATGRLLEGYSGVWIGDEKVCAIGVKVDAYGVTSHGFALNVNTDLSYFGHIIPCGIRDKGVTSLHQVLGHAVDMERAADAVVERMAQRFVRFPRGTGFDALRARLSTREAGEAQPAAAHARSPL